MHSHTHVPQRLGHTADGARLRAVICPIASVGNPGQVTLDVADHLYVVDSSAWRVLELDPEGKVRSVYSSVPADYAPDFGPTITDTYVKYAIQSREWKTSPDDEPLVEAYVYNDGGPATCTWSGGATHPPEGFVETAMPPSERRERYCLPPAEASRWSFRECR